MEKFDVDHFSIGRFNNLASQGHSYACMLQVRAREISYHNNCQQNHIFLVSPKFHTSSKTPDVEKTENEYKQAEIFQQHCSLQI